MNDYCFVIQPFDGSKYDNRYRDVIVPAVEHNGLDAYRVDRDYNAENLIETIEKKIRESVLCIADISEDNPNVWYEVGYAFASNKSVILICSDSRNSFPFDVRNRNILRYKTGSSSDFTTAKELLIQRIRAKRFLEKEKEFYMGIIEEVRKVPNVKDIEYGCYRLNGLIDTNKEIIRGERHWILCEKTKYPIPKCGDRVSFHVTGFTEIKNYKRAENTRNIYIDDMIIIT